MNIIHVTANGTYQVATARVGSIVGSGEGRRLCIGIRGSSLGGGTAKLGYRPDLYDAALVVDFAEYPALALPSQHQIAWADADIVLVLTGATDPDFYIDYATGS